MEGEGEWRHVNRPGRGPLIIDGMGRRFLPFNCMQFAGPFSSLSILYCLYNNCIHSSNSF